MATARDLFASLLADQHTTGTFSARRTARPDDLRLEVRGVGSTELPVSAKQAEELCRLARPARFGRGEQTLLDPGVRDTYQVPKTRVKIDKRHWDRTLRPVLDGLGHDLGLPPGCSLTAEFHAMLVYGPGQFFAPHQDSEKADAMIGTLVVMLPGDAKGGVLVVEHSGATATYRSSKTSLSFVAFYADCRHQVKPVTSGYRVVLTYNLMLHGDTASSAGGEADPALVDSLAQSLGQHFTTRIPVRYGTGDGDPPMRLVYLLDHEYTERGLSWGRLKGLDARRAAAAQAAAETAGCEIVLALADVHETWNAVEAWEPPRHRRWSWDDDECDDGWGGGGSSPDDYDLTELIESTVQLTCWLDQAGRQPNPTSLHVSDEEVCTSTPSEALSPYASEYEGYMGNYGNTMDRWYRRAALVLWPQQLAFAVRAEASPRWALDAVAEQVRSNVAGARESAATLAPFWKSAVGGEQRRGVLTQALRVARALDEPGLAAMLLAPFRVEMLARSHAGALARLAARYGASWSGDLVGVWFGGDRPGLFTWVPDRRAWVESLPALAEALSAGGDGVEIARSLVTAAWRSLCDWVGHCLSLDAPSRREQALNELGPAIAAVLTSAAVTGTADLRDEAVGFLSQDNEHLFAGLMPALRGGAKLAPEMRRESGLQSVAAHCAAQLSTRLARPQRADDDWSIELPDGCTCELCTTLGTFLGDPARRLYEWPLVQQNRRHIHSRIDMSELPIRHETRRTGRPYTLVLTKTAALFEHERDARRRDQADLASLKLGYAIR